jgi:RecT family
MTNNNDNSTALAVHQAPTEAAPLASAATLAFEPSDMRGAYDLAKILIASRLLPKGITSPEAAFTIIMTGREMGLTAMQSIRSMHIIEGKPTMSADLMVAMCKRSPTCKYFTIIESTDERAVYETHRAGEPKPTRVSFSMDDARRAGVASKNTWKQYPAAMLRARASAALCRAVYPDVTLGVYDTDEIGPSTQAAADVTVTVHREEPPMPPAAIAEAAREVVAATDAAVELDLLAEQCRAAWDAATTKAEVEAVSAKAGPLDKARKMALVPVRAAAMARVEAQAAE